MFLLVFTFPESYFQTERMYTKIKPLTTKIHFRFVLFHFAFYPRRLLVPVLSFVFCQCPLNGRRFNDQRHIASSCRSSDRGGLCSTLCSFAACINVVLCRCGLINYQCIKNIPISLAIHASRPFVISSLLYRLTNITHYTYPKSHHPHTRTHYSQ